jgi:hypothetical protein
MLNPETMTKAKEKEHFKEFMEDFNTGTINEKYADLAKWEKKQAAIRNGETLEDNSIYDPRADLECQSPSRDLMPCLVTLLILSFDFHRSQRSATRTSARRCRRRPSWTRPSCKSSAGSSRSASSSRR